MTDRPSGRGFRQITLAALGTIFFIAWTQRIIPGAPWVLLVVAVIAFAVIPFATRD